MLQRLLKPTAFKVALLIGLAFGALHLLRSVGLVHAHYLDLIEAKALDWKFQLRGPLLLSHQVALAEVDERAIQKYGLWPWNRRLIAQALTHLDQAGALAIGLDMIISDTDRNSAYRTLEAFKTELSLPADDDFDQRAQALLTQAPPGMRAELGSIVQAAMQSHDRLRESSAALDRALGEAPDLALKKAVELSAEKLVLGMISINDPRALAAIPAERRSAWDRETSSSAIPGTFEIDRAQQRVAGGAAVAGRRWTLDQSQQLQAWLPEIAGEGRHLGYFNVSEDADGTLRRYVPLAQYREAFYPALAIASVARASHSAIYPVQSVWSSHSLDAVALYLDKGGLVRIPVDPFDRSKLLINFLGPNASWHGPLERSPEGKPVCAGATCDRVSMAEVVEGTFDPAIVKDKVVFVGVTAIGTFDQRVTPFDAFGPGVFLHLNVAEDIVSQRFLQHPGYLTLVELMVLIVLALAFGLVLPRVRFGYQLASFPVMGLAYLGGDVTLFAHGTQLFTVTPLLELAALTFGVVFFQYVSIDREKRQVRQAFQYYLTESVMEEMLKDPSKLKLGGDKKELTVLFSDIRGFTTLSEMLEASEVARTLNEYLTPMTDLVFAHGGTLDKYMGDAIMAFWGAPVDQADHALRACATALDMIARLDLLRADWRAKGRPDIDIGIGLNSGLIHVGNMGSDARFDYTVIGDDVNLGSRLEGTNKIYGTRIIIGENTHRLVKGRVVARELGGVMVKGKKKPVIIHELRGMGAASADEAKVIATFELGLTAYRARDWAAAESAFHQVLTAWPDDGPAEKYLDDLTDKRDHPPGEGWDGVYVMKTK